MPPLRPWARPLAIVVAVGLGLAACGPSPSPAPAARPAPTPPTPAPSPPVVGRSELLRALDAASSAYAAGGVDETPDLSGRRFIVRQTFGCSGPTPLGGGQEAGQAAWRWTSKDRTIELSLQPADWKRWVPTGETDRQWEAVEGFWLARPWLRTDGCPAQRGTPPPTPGAVASVAPSIGSPQTAGLAAVFEPGGSRVGRRSGRAFTHTIRSDDGPLSAPTAGYRLVLEGRFTSFAGDRAIRCLAPGPDVRPVCIAGANVDRIAFESADGEVLAEWRSG